MEIAAMSESGAAAARFGEATVGRLLALGAPAYRLAVNILGSVEGAEDAVQQAYLEVVNFLRSNPPPDDERAWFLRAVANTARDHLRGKARRRKREAAVSNHRRATAPAQGTGAEMAAVLKGALTALAEEYCLPLTLCYQEGLSQREAASILEIPERTFSRRVQKGLDLLRKALARAGYTAASTMVIGGLAHTAPPVPATLTAALEKLVGGQMVVRGTGAAATAAAAKGGLTVKIVAGVVLAGTLAGGVALLMPGKGDGKPASPPPASAPAPKGKPTGEHWAFVNTAGRLDGPRREAMGIATSVAVDDAGNIYSNGRVIRVDGMVETIWADNYNLAPTGLEEGPACWFTARLAAPASWSAQGALAVQGSPLGGGDRGCLYLAAAGDVVYKVWKNKDKKDRWWFKRVMGGGFAALPAPGQSVPALGVKLGGPKMVQGHDGRIYVRAGHYAYPDILRYDDQKGELTCILSPEDYRDKLDKNRTGSPAGVSTVKIGADGTIYLGCRLAEGDWPIYRVSADRSKVKKIVHGYGLDKGWDGRAIGSGYFDGPILTEYYPPDNLFMTAVDDSNLRRYKDGRVSTLCADGEWREFPKKDKCGSAMLPMYGYKGKDTDSAIIGRRFVLYKDYVYMLYFNGLGSHAVLRFGLFDFNKPTVGPLVEGE